MFPRKHHTLITTNLDNDDGLGRGFTAALQMAKPTGTRTALYLSRGLIKSQAGLYLRRDRFNAFCSVRETWDDPVTCWADWHNRLHLQMPTEDVGDRPHWLQVVHGSNVSNRTRGRLVSPAAYRNEFIGLDDVEDPSATTLWLDLLSRSPGRVLRDTARATSRRTAVLVLGKDGVNRLKATAFGQGRRRA